MLGIVLSVIIGVSVRGAVTIVDQLLFLVAWVIALILAWTVVREA